MSTSTLDQKEFPNYYIADQLIKEIKSDISTLEDLDPLFLLDMMGVLGIQFVEGNNSSNEYIKICSM
mgnify:CR=1 FL=1